MMFSIIVPVYNGEKYIKQCVTTLQHQTYKDFEVIFVNDGSTDNSAAILEDELYHVKLKHKIITKENGGQISARYMGINNAEAQYCLFLDCDDTLRNNTLEELNKYISKNANADIVVFNGSRVYDDKRELFWPEYSSNNCEIPREDFLEKVINSRRFNNICFKAIRTTIMRDSCIYSGVGFVKAEEDLLMQLPFFDKAKHIFYINGDFYNYTYNPESVTNTYNNNIVKGNEFVTSELEKYGQAWLVKNYKDACNTRYFKNIITAMKQLKLCTNLTLQDKKIKFSEIASSSCFKEKYRRIEACNLTLKQRIVLFLLKNHMNFILMRLV